MRRQIGREAIAGVESPTKISMNAIILPYIFEGTIFIVFTFVAC